MAHDNIHYQLGLLHLVHLLVTVDGHIDDRERAAIAAIRREENMSEQLCLDFEKKVETLKEQEIYSAGINLYQLARTKNAWLPLFICIN